MTISQHLKLTLFVLIGLAFAGGFLGLWMRGWIEQRAYSNLQREMEVLLLLEDIESGLLSVRNAEKSFLLRYPVDGLEMSQTQITVARKAIDQTRKALQSVVELKAGTGQGEGEDYSERIKTSLSLFELHLLRVVKLAQRKGDGTSGLVWEMRRMAEGLERYLGQLEEGVSDRRSARYQAIQNVKNHLLFIRRWEKDYFLRDDLVFISFVQGRAGLIEKALEGGPFNERERGRILTYLHTFLIYFERIALNDVQVLDERNRLNQVAEDMQSLVSAFVASERADLARTETELRERARQTSYALLMLFLVLLGVSALLAIRLTRRITWRLDTLVGATEQLGERGDAPPIEMDTHDEFARLAEAFNGMVERLRTTQLQLVQSEKLTATGKLSASVAHEINNPLFGIQGCLERIQKKLPDDDSDRRLVELALRESQRIARLVQGLRDYYRPSDQTMSPVDLLETLDDVFLINGKYLQQARVELVRNLPPTLPSVEGTRDQLQMVFVNLITNAAEAMPDGGTLTVSASQDKGKVMLHFADTGKGIDPEVLHRLFEPFFSTKSEVKGVGLGLSISYGIIKRHGGEILIDSSPGKTVFTVSLPVLRGEEPERA